MHTRFESANVSDQLAQAEADGIRIAELTKRYGRQAAVDNVSIDISSGSFVTFLGPSGSGKTTLLMAIAGFVQPSSGTISLAGRDITHVPPEKRNLGMVFQGYALFPHMTVEDNVWFPLRVRGLARSQARDAVRKTLELVQMGHLAKRFPAELSGGQQQRVALARALVFEPRLLLLDEPLSALDKALRSDLQWELKSLHRKLGATFVNVTHDQEEALSMSDEIVILREGRVEQIGAPKDLYARPGTRFVASFLGESNFLKGRVAGIDSDKFYYLVGDERFVQAGSAGDRMDGDEALISLRPENITIGYERPATTNAIRGSISNFKYVGSNYFVQVDAGPLGTIMVRSNAHRASIDPQSPSPLWIGWDADSSVVVRDH